MFKRLVIEHYRSITNVDISLGNTAIFVGKNSSGKSNIIDAIHFLQEAFRHSLDFSVSQRFGIKSIRQWSPTRPFRIRISVDVENNRRGHGSFTLKLDSDGDNFVVFEEEGFWQYADEFPTASIGGAFIKFSRSRSGQVKFESSPKTTNLLRAGRFKFDESELAISSLAKVPFGEARGIRDLWTEIQNFEAYSIYANTIRDPQKPSNYQQLSRHGENISTVVKALQLKRRTNKGFEELNSLMRLVIPNLDTIGVESIGGLLAPKFIMISEGAKRHSFNVSQISDGSLRLLGLLCALYQPSAPAVVALEEPEQNINPGFLTIIAEAVKEIAASRQILITTHSPHLIDHFDVTMIHAVELRSTGTFVGKVGRSQVEAVKRKLFTVGELMTTEGLIVS